MVAIDWFEVGGVIAWNQDMLPELEAAALEARRTRRMVNLTLGQYTVQVHREGLGEGQDSYMKFHINWDDISIGLDPRLSTDRMLYNFRLCASGEPCVVLGLAAILRFQDNLITVLGGRLVDSWVKRIDVCCDIANKPLIGELLQQLREGCYITSSRNPIERYDTSFAVMSQGIRLSGYDKLEEMRVNSHSAAYRKAMLRQRWAEVLPTTATRIEVELRKDWLYSHGMRTTAEVLRRLPEVVAIATSTAPRSFFRITESVPDRMNGHQARAKTLPIWKWITECLRAGFPATPEPLKRRKRRQQT